MPARPSSRAKRAGRTAGCPSSEGPGTSAWLIHTNRRTQRADHPRLEGRMEAEPRREVAAAFPREKGHTRRTDAWSSQCNDSS